MIWPIDNMEFDSELYCSKLSTTICKIALENFDGPWNSFHEFNPKAKILFLEEFLTCYRWKHDESPGECREVLERIAAKRYKDVLHRCRDDCKEKFGWDIEKWKEQVPVWCKDAEHWATLCDLWSSEEWQKLSEKAQYNRWNSGQVAKHSAGSESVFKHKKEWVKQWKIDNNTDEDPNDYTDLFILLHTKKKRTCHGNDAFQQNDPITEMEGEEDANQSDNLGLYDDKQQEILDRFKELQQDPENKDKPQETLWMIAAREANRGRTYGFGSLFDKIEIPTTNTRARPSNYSSLGATSNSTVYTKEDVERLLEEHEQKYAEERAKDRAGQERKEAERDATIQFMFSQVYAKLSQTPSMPTLLHMPTLQMPTNIMQHRSFAPPLIGNNTSQGSINEEYLGSASTSTSKAMGEFTALLGSQEQGAHGYANGYENFT